MSSMRTLIERGIPGSFGKTPDARHAGGPGGVQRPEPEAQAFQRFLEAYPAYLSTAVIDAHRATELGRLDRAGQVYLDYTGGSLYGDTQLRDHMALLRAEVLGNPHSRNLTSLAMTELVERARARVLRFFNASPDEYMAIFTANATGALKLVGEAYPFAPGDSYLLTADNHNSVNGIREFARARDATVTYLPLVAPELRADGRAVSAALERGRPGRNNLFAYPAQSNFSGVQHPLEWIEQAQRRGWDVLLDATAFAPTNRLDLGRWRPDFVSLSFYKLFGYPTGVGCLLVRKSVAERLRRPWFAGGTITFSSIAAENHYLTPGVAGFEDGTVNYLSLPAVESGLALLDALAIETIHTRVACLTGWLIDALLALRHSDGRPVVRLYGPAGIERRGGAVQVNFFAPDGRRHDCYQVEQLANAEGISLRAGCHCNPGAREAALGLTRAELEPCFRDKDQLSYAQFLQVIAGKQTGAVRASLGLASNFADVAAFVAFARSFVDRRVELA